MFIVFGCPGMPFRGDTIEKGKSLGGSESACYYVARDMARRGHRVTVFTTHPQAAGLWDNVNYVYCGPQSQMYPVGESFHTFLESADMDVLVMQRATGIMRIPHQAKVAFLWLHDLALIRSLPAMRHDAPYYDGLLAVSAWHRQQILDTWHSNPENVHVLRNAVDKSLYDLSTRREPCSGGVNLLYQSRPERGIDHLIRPGGIMARLWDIRTDIHLHVCGYDNTTDQMRAYYASVYAQCERLPNVTVHGHLSKADLAELQLTLADVLVYPGSFEETSCITAMEAQCAGLPMLASDAGALAETCVDPGTHLIPLCGNGQCDEDAFVDWLTDVSPPDLARMSAGQIAGSTEIDWAASGDKLEDLIADTLGARHVNPFSMARSMLDRSDIKFLELYRGCRGNSDEGIVPEIAELNKHYGFQHDLGVHYDQDHAISALEEDQNLDVRENRRFQFVKQEVYVRGHRPSHVLDYGCQKGHYMWSLAVEDASARYVGVDISSRTIDWASKTFKARGIDNCRFVCDDARRDGFDAAQFGKFDTLILAETLEHVPDPVELCAALEPLLMPGARVVITTPFGEWEGKDYHNRPDAARYHLHHFELNDLHDMFSHHGTMSIVSVLAGKSAHGNLGAYVTSFDWDGESPLCRPVDYERKMSEYVPRQTLSFCALARNAEHTILRSLATVRDVADEFIIALDRGSRDDTRAVLEKFRDQFCQNKRFEIIESDSPLDIGFDEARNRTIRAARGDWIMWMDCDEDFIHPERLGKFLRHNMFDGYGIAQNHLSADPPAILTTDWPVRVFRNVPYLKFQGVVHEHPDDTDNPNRGPRCPAQLLDVHILHHGYTTEDVRRSRFQRNLPLIKRDRAQYPDRLLGRMLWMRDLAHMCMFELEHTGGQITLDMRQFAVEGVAEYESLLARADGNPIAARMVRDGLEFYTTLVNVLGEGFDVDLGFHASKIPGTADLAQGPRRRGRFLNRAQFDKYVKLCLDEQLEILDSKYW